MSVQSDEFQVIFPSTVKGNPRNKPYQYEAELSKPLDLPGEWDVALIDISYPHNWDNLDKSYSYFILRLNDEKHSDFQPRAINDEVEIYDIITKLTEFQGWVVERGPKINRGNYDISTILNLIETQFHFAFSDNIINLNINQYQYRVEINPNVKFAIACYSEISVLQLLGFGSQTNVKKTQGNRTIEFMIFEPNKYVQAKFPPSLKRISNMYVYSDIVELSPVGNSQVPIMGFLPIKSQFQENGHWVFNLPLYVRVKEKNINAITMKICTGIGEDFPIEAGEVICRLHFRRRPFLA